MLGHSGLVWSYGSHRLVELPTLDGNGKAGCAVSPTLDLGIDDNAGTECQETWHTHTIGLVRRQYPLLIFHVLGALDVCRRVNYDTEHDPSQRSMMSRGIYNRIPLLVRNEVKTRSLDVLHSSKVLCHRSRALQFVFPGCIFS
jgi:hypothetical protein